MRRKRRKQRAIPLHKGDYCGNQAQFAATSPARGDSSQKLFCPQAASDHSATPSVVSASKAMANKANNRDHASISLTRASAKPRYHLASRKPSSQQNRKPYSLAIGSARSLRLLTRYQVSSLPFLLRARLMVIQSWRGDFSQ